MVEATQAYHPESSAASASQVKVLIAIRVVAERIAREEVKQEIRDRGDKIANYAAAGEDQGQPRALHRAGQSLRARCGDPGRGRGQGAAQGSTQGPAQSTT